MRSQSIDKVFRIILNDDFIRKNVDSFFLYTENYRLLSRYIFEKKAIAYGLKDYQSGEYLGVFLAFRSRNCLYGHFLFQKHHGVNIICVIAEMIRRMHLYFKKNGIQIAKIVGHIPEKNKAAIWVAQKLGAKYKRHFCVNEKGRIVEYILPLDNHL